MFNSRTHCIKVAIQVKQKRCLATKSYNLQDGPAYGCQVFSAKRYVLTYQIAFKNAKAFLCADNSVHF